ncbi:MAG TPA: GDSL-type esterase/lipase family protein [Hanamia sp.]|jgi:lysophospholipase L1-like esterase|nr:GDSL-type esterase/lipase family protein [Hanamia sp.]
MSKKLKLLVVLLLLFGFVKAQTKPFYPEIQQFKKQDSIHFPPKHAIVFLGSSSFRKWKDVQKYFPGYTIVNRGFGGSTIPDAIYYADDIVFPYNPKQVVIYEGDNDLAASDKITADSVLNRFEKLFSLIRKKLPNTSIAFVSIKPSPSREKLMPEMREANSLIKKFLSHQKNAAFIDVYHAMLNKDGTPDKSLFIEDELHMNDKGYHIWQKIIKPYLLKK